MSRSDDEKHKIDKEVQQTLESFDDVQDIETGAYFYTRLKAQIDSSEPISTAWSATSLLGRRLAPALLTAVIILNVLSVVWTLGDSDDGMIESQQQYVEVLADEYLLTGTSSWLDIGAE